MQVYKTKTRKFSGSDFHEAHQKAFGLYTEIKRKSKRRTYIRSAFFDKEKAKIFDFGIPGRGPDFLLK